MSGTANISRKPTSYWSSPIRMSDLLYYRSLSSDYAWDNTGNMYNVSKIIDDSGKLDKAAYEAYSPLYLS
jgi:hypothetical protein